jgi:hypothetical protein
VFGNMDVSTSWYTVTTTSAFPSPLLSPGYTPDPSTITLGEPTGPTNYSGETSGAGIPNPNGVYQLNLTALDSGGAPNPPGNWEWDGPL